MIEGLTWLAVKTSAKKAWLLCKKYWQILLGISIPLVLMLVFRKKTNLSAVLDRAREDHQKEIDAIEESHRSEIEARDQAQKRYFDTIKQLEEKYESEKMSLEKKKKKQVEKILKDNKDNPEEITKKIADLTGFEVFVK